MDAQSHYSRNIVTWVPKNVALLILALSDRKANNSTGEFWYKRQSLAWNLHEGGVQAAGLEASDVTDRSQELRVWTTMQVHLLSNKSHFEVDIYNLVARDCHSGQKLEDASQTHGLGHIVVFVAIWCWFVTLSNACCLLVIVTFAPQSVAAFYVPPNQKFMLLTVKIEHPYPWLNILLNSNYLHIFHVWNDSYGCWCKSYPSNYNVL